MAKNLNRKRIFYLNKKNLFYIFLLLCLMYLIFTIYSNKNYFKNFFINSVENFSKNYQYQYVNLNVNGLKQVKYSYIKNKLQKYHKSSIFLLPLDKISNEIKENNWIKIVKLKTNYKDTLFIYLEEYKSLGIYKFNNKLFYFDKYGKIIEETDNKNKYDRNLIIFFGQSSNLKAKTIIDIFESINFHKKYQIKQVDYIEKRRWDVILHNNITLMLSEDSPIQSLQNFINIEKNLSETNLNNIKYFDLRNINKTLITYLND